MPSMDQSKDVEIKELRERLEEAEETLRAIRNGEVDALVASTPEGDHVFTLKSAEQPYRVFIEQMEEGAVMISKDDSIIYSNKGFAKMVRKPIESIVGSDIHDLVAPIHSEIFRELLSKARREGAVSRSEITFRTAKGTLVPSQISINELGLDDLKALCLIATDMSKHMEEEVKRYTSTLEKLVEERTEEVEEQAELLNVAQEAIIVEDLEGCIEYWNNGAQQMYGWTGEEAIGKKVRELLQSDPIETTEALRQTKTSGTWRGEMEHTAKDGKKLIIESSWTLVYDDKQKPKSIITINMNISEKKALEGRYLRAQRLESLGTLAGGIAHDFRNILTPVMITLGLIDQHLTRKEDHEMIAALQRNLQRGSDLARQLLIFGRGEEGKSTPISVPSLLLEIEKTLKETFPRSIFIEVKNDPSLPLINGDITQLHQVLINLSLNARDAMPYGGTLSITAERTVLDPYYARGHPDAKPGPYIIISVKDDGIGMPMEVLDRLFEPFFTTKKPGEGTGLGLSTARSIVKGHGGFINVYSEVGKGSTFRVYLPVTETRAGTQEEPQGAELPQGRGQTILVVDDEELIRITALAALDGNGYKGLEASDGADALGVYMKHKDEISAVILDMAMPIMDGEATVRALKKIDPQLKIIGMSGLAETGRYKAVHVFANEFITKPFTASMLLNTLAKVLR